MATQLNDDYLQGRSIADLQAGLTDGSFSSRELVEAYLERIERLDRDGPALRSIIELNPDAGKIAAKSDTDRRVGRLRGQLHGIPIVLKDNIDTKDKMLTTAGSLSLVKSKVAADASVAFRLRMSGAIILGKTNMSEWANFRAFHSTSGWSGRGGQTRNPYHLDYNPSGSSSGSAVAVAASLAAGAVGTETDGSIVSPSNSCGIVGVKPTVGLVSRAGVIPIAASQDTVGPMARTVSDAAALLSAMTGIDPRDPATEASRGKLSHNYLRYLKPDGLKGARIGVIRDFFTGIHEETDALFEQAIDDLRAGGAIIVDPANIPTARKMAASPGELNLLMYEFRRDLPAYLASRIAAPKAAESDVPRTLEDILQFNSEHAEQELAFFPDDLMEACAKLELSEARYLEIREENQRLAGAEGIDAALEANSLDALIAPTAPPAWVNRGTERDSGLRASSAPAAMAGYPLVTVPMGFVGDLPVGLTFMGTAWSEPVLLRLAFGYEQRTMHRREPKFLTGE